MTTATQFDSNQVLVDRLRAAVGHAIMAPSSHNTQPWQFRIKTGDVELLTDLRRACPVVDPQNREMTISCGAALYQLKLALHCDSLATLSNVLPDRKDPCLVARVRIAGPHVPSDEERTLFDAIPNRRTNRFPFERREIDSELQTEWVNDVKSMNAWIRFIHSEKEKHAVADLVTEGIQLQAGDKLFRRELAKWLHSNTSSRRDGIPGYTHGVSNLASHFEWLAVRTFDWGDGQAAKDRQLAEGSPLLAVIGTDGDTPADWIGCGQALAKTLLRGTSWSVDASFLSQPIEVPQLRTKLAKLIGSSGSPQLLLRFGYGSEVKPTPRRPPEEVIVS